jgi:hypothetical protein
MHPVARVSTNTLIKTTVRNKCFSCSILLYTTTTCFGPDRWPSSGKMYTKNIFKVTTFYVNWLVVVVKKKIEHEKHLLRTVVLIKVLEEVQYLEALRVYCSTLLHCASAHISVTFNVCFHFLLVFTLLRFVANMRCILRPNWSSSAVQVDLTK